MSVTARLDDFQRRHPAAGFPLAVLYKYTDDSGGNLAALITYYGFLSLFPLLLLASTILGIVLSGDPSAQKTILDTAVGQFPVIGQQLQDPGKVGGGVAGLLVGGLGALYGAMGVALAVQGAMNTAWMIPKNSRPNPIKARGRARPAHPGHRRRRAHQRRRAGVRRPGQGAAQQGLRGHRCRLQEVTTR